MGRKFLPALRGLAGQAETKTLQPASGGEGKQISYGTYTSSTTIGGFGSSGTENRADGWDLGTVVSEGYEQNVWVFKCVEWYARNQSRLPFRIGRNLGTDQAENLDDHPLLRLLNGQANPLETGRQLRKRLSAQLLLNKRGAFVEVTKSRAGTITRLDLLPPDRVRPVPDPDNDQYVLYFEYHPRTGPMRQISPDRIRWVRDPHPTDPFSGVTPLEPAGDSVELDNLSRTYNTSYIKNDGRPGGIVGIDTEGLEDDELDRIERKFEPGAQNAGKITAVGTGKGGLDYVDTSAKPRDMSYETASQNSKTETLSAFGLDESVIGPVAGRTYDNAEQALYNAWTGEMPGHLDLIAGAFLVDMDDDWRPYIDTSSVEVLELPRRKKRDEARTEVREGLRTIDEYRPLAELEPFDSPYTRALWISPSKAPVPGRPEDAAALGVAIGDPNAPGAPGAGQPGRGPGMDGEGGLVAAPAGEQQAYSTAAEAVAAARTDSAATLGAAAQAVADARTLDSTGGAPGAAAAAVQAARDLEGKSMIEGKADTSVTAVEDAGSADDTIRTELGIAALLEALLARQGGVVIARMESPKARKGTRFWTAESADDTRAGDELLDPSRAVDIDRWATETADTLTPLVVGAAESAGAELLAVLAAAGVIAETAPSPTDTAEPAAEFTAHAAQAAAGVVAEVLAEAVGAMRDWSREVAHIIAVRQLVAVDLPEVTEAVRAHFAEKSRTFATSLAASLASAVVNGSREAAAAALTPLPTAQPATPDGFTFGAGIVRTWTTMGDTRVRQEHKDVHGETLPVGAPFTVGGVHMRFPGDPGAPPHLTRNCRCRAIYKTTTAAHLLLPPLQPAGTAQAA